MKAVQKKGFTDLWYIKKDDIKKCKDCEYRYMCLDCRIYITDPHDPFSAPAKCNYNPCTNKWQKKSIL